MLLRRCSTVATPSTQARAPLPLGFFGGSRDVNVEECDWSAYVISVAVPGDSEEDLRGRRLSNGSVDK